ncbi:hypothetical protein EDC32_10468 [Laceyella sacchari]|uniref:hypothetical protein n=1 Tax=Laceyella sacchari TaxID=37482 RepID=UPI00104599E9|nr:hypothetical protein [Laceyella sacchari]TCW36618.1 hypothetical protein EDC32_10468 [Laceyella sacchari]
MTKLQEWKLRLASAKEFFPRLSKKGSPTMEYVIIIAVGAAFAGLLLTIFADEEGGITKTLKTKVEEQIKGKE